MSDTQRFMREGVFDEALVTGELSRRPARGTDVAGESDALGRLASDLTANPRNVFSQVAALARVLCRSSVAAVMTFESSGGARYCRYEGASGDGPLAPGSMMLCEGPWSALASRDEPALLLARPGRWFPELDRLAPNSEEALVVLLRVRGSVVGAVWAISFEPGHFDREDARLLASVSRFAAAGCALLERTRAAEDQRAERVAALNLMEDAIAARAAAEQAQQALRESEERLRNILITMDEAFVVKEAVTNASGTVTDWRYVECNPAFARHTGVTDPLGRTVREVMPNIEPKWIERYAEVLRTGVPIRFQDRLAAIDRWLDVFASRVGGRESRRVALIFRDITNRKLSEEALRSSEERMRLILESAREYAIFAMDLERRVTSWSSGAERVLGFSEAEMLGKSGDIVFTPEDRAAGAPAHEAQTALSEGRAADERWHLRKNRTRFWGSGVLMPMRGATGETVGLVKVLRDQTEAKRNEEALAASRSELEHALAETQRAREEAETANRTKDHFLATLSHELRTPLTPVLTACESLLKQKDLSPRAREALEMILRNVELETQFIDDLLDLTRIARSKFELRRATLDVHEVIAAAVEVSRPDLIERDQTLRMDLTATNHTLSGDRGRLQQVFWNLLKNASKFTPALGHIVVRSRNEGAALVVEVTDTGRGIEAAEMEHVFEPFRQEDPSVAQEFGGLGLGLAIAKAAVDAHRGSISASSEGRGRGATFQVRLPI